MIIEQITPISHLDKINFAWRGLRRFHNTNYTSEKLVHAHAIPEKQKPNANKQADQIRLCLMLAKDYFDAAQTVSLTTKPVLIYYSIMNLAVAEVLFKQTGASSLDRAREQHRHHGLTCSVGPHKPNDTLVTSSENLVAKPVLRDHGNERFGTFELWHRSARHHSAIGHSSDLRNKTTTICTLTRPDDERKTLLPKSGVDLMYCAKRLPALSEFLAVHDVTQEVTRGAIFRQITKDGGAVIHHTFQPTNKNLLMRVLDQFHFAPGHCEDITCELVGGGATMSLTLHPGNIRHWLSLCQTINENADQLYFMAEECPLNEFGLYYIAMFILGNYARYFPDK